MPKITAKLREAYIKSRNIDAKLNQKAKTDANETSMLMIGNVYNHIADISINLLHKDQEVLKQKLLNI